MVRKKRLKEQRKERRGRNITKKTWETSNKGLKRKEKKVCREEKS